MITSMTIDRAKGRLYMSLDAEDWKVRGSHRLLIGESNGELTVSPGEGDRVTATAQENGRVRINFGPERELLKKIDHDEGYYLLRWDGLRWNGEWSRDCKRIPKIGKLSPELAALTRGDLHPVPFFEVMVEKAAAETFTVLLDDAEFVFPKSCYARVIKKLVKLEEKLK